MAFRQSLKSPLNIFLKFLGLRQHIWEKHMWNSISCALFNIYVFFTALLSCLNYGMWGMRNISKDSSVLNACRRKQNYEKRNPGENLRKL